MADTLSPVTADTDPAILREIVRLGEAQMGDILAMALAADTRANTLSYTLATVAAGLIVVAATLYNSTLGPGPAFAAAFASGISFLIAAGVAMMAAKPALFYPRGFSLADLTQDIPSESQLLLWIAEDLDRNLETNRTAQAETIRLTTLAHRLSIVAAAVAPLTAMIDILV